MVGGEGRGRGERTGVAKVFVVFKVLGLCVLKVLVFDFGELDHGGGLWGVVVCAAEGGLTGCRRDGWIVVVVMVGWRRRGRE